MALEPHERHQSRIILIKKSAVLLLKRTDRKGWETPGGWIQHEETPHRAAIRETKEETNLDCKTLFEMHPCEYDEGHIRHVVHMFAGIVVGGRIRLSDAHDAYEWVAIERIPHITDAIHHEKLIEYVHEAQHMLAHAGMNTAPS